MWSPRAQCDKSRFSAEWRRTLENTPTSIFGRTLRSNCSSGSSLRRRVGRKCAGFGHRWGGVLGRLRDPDCRDVSGGDDVLRSFARRGRPCGDSASHGVTESLVAMGFEAGRMKTGTPARLDARTINFEILEPQYGDENPSKFSFSADTHPVQNQLPCFLVYTSKKVHDILRKGFGDSPLFNGTIRGSVPVIARVSRTSSTHSLIRTSTSFFSSRRVVRPTNIT